VIVFGCCPLLILYPVISFIWVVSYRQKYRHLGQASFFGFFLKETVFIAPVLSLCVVLGWLAITRITNSGPAGRTVKPLLGCKDHLHPPRVLWFGSPTSRLSNSPLLGLLNLWVILFEWWLVRVEYKPSLADLGSLLSYAIARYCAGPEPFLFFAISPAYVNLHPGLHLFIIIGSHFPLQIY